MSYLVQGIIYDSNNEERDERYIFGSATKEQLENTNYVIKILNQILNEDSVIDRVIASPIKKINFSKMINYGEPKGLINLFEKDREYYGEEDEEEDEDGEIDQNLPLKRHIKKLLSYAKDKRMAKSIFSQKNLSEDLEKGMTKYFGFGKKRKKVVKKKVLTKALKNQAKKYKVRLTLKRGNKRVYKSEKILKQQIRSKMK